MEICSSAAQSFGRDGGARNARADELVAQLLDAAELAVAFDVGQQASGAAFESGALRKEERAVIGAELRPGDGADESSGAEAVRAEHVFNENANGPGEEMERVVKGHHAAGNEMGHEAVEVGFGAGPCVIAIDPEKADGAGPVRGDIDGMRAMGLNHAGNAG